MKCSGMVRDGGGDKWHHGLVRRLRVRVRRLHTAPGGSRVKIIRGIAEFTPERVAKSTVPSTVPRHLLSRQRTKSSLYDQVQGGWEIVVGAKAKAWTLGKLATVYAWMSSAQSF